MLKRIQEFFESIWRKLSEAARKRALLRKTKKTGVQEPKFFSAAKISQKNKTTKLPEEEIGRESEEDEEGFAQGEDELEEGEEDFEEEDLDKEGTKESGDEKFEQGQNPRSGR